MMKYGHESMRNKERGIALLVVMMILGVFILIGLALVLVVRQERLMVFNEATHQRAFYAADAGISRGADWLADREIAPSGLPGDTVQKIGQEKLPGAHQAYACTLVMRGRYHAPPEYSTEYLGYHYWILSEGESPDRGQSDIEAVGIRIIRESY
jgi:Tfp pilus assembly protein PilX